MKKNGFSSLFVLVLICAVAPMGAVVPMAVASTITVDSLVWSSAVGPASALLPSNLTLNSPTGVTSWGTSPVSPSSLTATTLGSTTVPLDIPTDIFSLAYLNTFLPFSQEIGGIRLTATLNVVGVTNPLIYDFNLFVGNISDTDPPIQPDFLRLLPVSGPVAFNDGILMLVSFPQDLLAAILSVPETETGTVGIKMSLTQVSLDGLPNGGPPSGGSGPGGAGPGSQCIFTDQIVCTGGGGGDGNGGTLPVPNGLTLSLLAVGGIAAVFVRRRVRK